MTQRGVDRGTTFTADDDRVTYLRLLRDNLADAEVRILAWCQMTNHVHLVAVPEQANSLSILFRRLHGRYAQYYNARWGRTGHPAGRDRIGSLPVRWGRSSCGGHWSRRAGLSEIRCVREL